MSKIINYFTPEIEQNIFNQQKTKAFIVIGFISIVLASIMILKSILFTEEFNAFILFPAILILIFVVINLFILKYKGIILVGNIFSIGIVTLIALSSNIISKDLTILYKLTGGFYTLLGMYSVSVLFASRSVIIINATIILFTSTRVLFFGLEHFPDLEKILKNAYTNHTIALIVISLMIYFTSKFVEKSLTIANKDAKIKDDQYKKINSIFIRIKNSSNTLTELSNELNNSANSLSSNSSEQAASVEEVSATMEQITASIIQNANNSEDTAHKVNKTTEIVKNNNDITSKTSTAINNINSKIGLIHEIAFQTNILALNAAIEAAAAGEAGKGFSVVAKEVKKLADNSKDGANKIISLVEIALKNSDSASNYQQIIADNIEEINEIINEISISSTEQKNSAEQVNNSINQINESAQKNATISEELAASVYNITNEAKKLNNILKKNEIDIIKNSKNKI